jgi:NADPH:quinone reductase-like Zn-dependent oxidoreductase
MRAIVQTAFGSPEVLALREVDRPVPGEGEALIRVCAASINAGDYFVMSGASRFLRVARPNNRILGWDVAGEVEAVGGNVTDLHMGDEVFGECDYARGGSFAEYACARADRLGPKPASLTFEEAAAVPVAGVGTFALQIARVLGAEVTGVCSARNVEMVRQIGADHVIDYTREDFTQKAERYDLILDNIGTHPFSHYRRVLTHRGKVIPNTGHAGIGYILRAFLVSAFLSQQGSMFSGTANREDLFFLKDLIESGRVTPVIDRVYPLAEAPEALGYVGARHARGKVVITMSRDTVHATDAGGTK